MQFTIIEFLGFVCTLHPAAPFFECRAHRVSFIRNAIESYYCFYTLFAKLVIMKMNWTLTKFSQIKKILYLFNRQIILIVGCTYLETTIKTLRIIEIVATEKREMELVWASNWQLVRCLGKVPTWIYRVSQLWPHQNYTKKGNKDLFFHVTKQPSSLLPLLRILATPYLPKFKILPITNRLKSNTYLGRCLLVIRFWKNM